MRKSSSSSHLTPPPSCAGPHAATVRWVNELFHWLYTDQVISGEVLQQWLGVVNEQGVKGGLEEVSFAWSLLSKIILTYFKIQNIYQ